MKGIDARGLKKWFFESGKKIEILGGLTFSVPKGSNLAVIGPNGSGKTTLLKVLATILTPDAGRAYIRGLDIIDDVSRVRRIVSYINPEFRLHERLTVKRTIKFFAAIQGVKWKNALPYLEAFELKNMIDSQVGALSTGQKAALRFIIGLMKEPEVLFLDEVFSGLDIRRSEKLLVMVEELLKEKGIDIVMVDHNPDILDRLCDRVIIMERGKPVNKVYSTEEILSKFDYRWDIIITWLRRIDNELLKELEESYDCRTIIVGPDKARIFVKSDDVVKEITDIIIKRSRDAIEINTSPVTLKDLFLEVIMKQTKFMTRQHRPE